MSAYKGDIISFRMDNSVVYPGTQRTIEVYVPAGYDGKTPACQLVRMDGGASFFAGILDSLIENKAIPMMIGVFVQPGRVYAKDGSVIRYNRSNEYDRVDGKFVGFLETEVLPAVEALSTPDGRKIVLSHKASDRAITGGSSGGICAFNAAWQRPDLFSRVYSVIGTFVSFRGGDQYPAFVRKGEPRRLRVFLQDNMNDTWNPLFGSWFEYNRILLSALEFGGYDVRHQWNEGGHSGRNGDEIFPQVMAWLWSGWPGDVPLAKTGNATINDMLVPGEEWVYLGEVSDQEAMLYPISDSEVLLREGKNSWKVEPDGTRAAVKAMIKCRDPFTAPYPGGTKMAKAVQGSNRVWDYVIDDEGQPANGQEFYCLYGDAGQILFDNRGYLYAATEDGIEVCDQNGRVRALLSLPGGKVSSIAYAGNHLFALSGGKMYVRKMKRSGTFDGIPDSEGEG